MVSLLKHKADYDVITMLNIICHPQIQDNLIIHVNMICFTALAYHLFRERHRDCQGLSCVDTNERNHELVD